MHRSILRLIAGSLVIIATLGPAGTAHAQQPAVATAGPSLATAPDQQFTADGVNLRYRDVGTGTPVILIHGYAAILEGTFAVARTLPDTYRKVAFDVRGFGRSSKFADPARFGQAMVDDVVRLMDHLKIDRAHLIGHSMGALIAANVAARYPARVMTATLVAGPFYADHATFTKETGRWVSDLESGVGLTNFVQWLFPVTNPEMAAVMSAGMIKANDLPSLVATLRSLPALAIPGLPKGGNTILLVAGTADPLFPLSTAFAKLSPGSRIVEVAGADHVSVITNPAAVTAIGEIVKR